MQSSAPTVVIKLFHGAGTCEKAVISQLVLPTRSARVTLTTDVITRDNRTDIFAYCARGLAVVSRSLLAIECMGNRTYRI